MYPADLRYSKEHEWVKVEGRAGGSGSRTRAARAGHVVFVEVPRWGGPSRRWRRSASSSP